MSNYSGCLTGAAVRYQIIMLGVTGFLRNQWLESIGMGGWLRPEQWKEWSGICTCLPPLKRAEWYSCEGELGRFKLPD